MLPDTTVKFASDCIGEEAEKAAAELKPGEILVLENTRFYKGEEKDDLELAKGLADLADLYVNDAFGTAHRAHSSTEGVTHFKPGVAGFLLEKEIQYLSSAIEDPKRPFVAILGGAKISDKIGVIKNLLSKADKVLIGGGMANTFFAAQGYNMADSLVQDEAIDTAKEILAAGSVNWFCLLTLLSRMPLITTPKRRSLKSAIFRKAGACLISVRRPLNCTAAWSLMRLPLFGTARWVSSKCLNSR